MRQKKDQDMLELDFVKNGRAFVFWDFHVNESFPRK